MLLTPRDIQMITGMSDLSAAQRTHLAIRDALGKTAKYLTIKEYCEYCEIDYKETVEFLNDNR